MLNFDYRVYWIAKTKGKQVHIKFYSVILLYCYSALIVTKCVYYQGSGRKSETKMPFCMLISDNLATTFYSNILFYDFYRKCLLTTLKREDLHLQFVASQLESNKLSQFETKQWSLRSSSSVIIFGSCSYSFSQNRFRFRQGCKNVKFTQ